MKGNLSVSTTRLLKTVLPGSCLWTGLRDVEGFGFNDTMEELKRLYPDDDDAMEEGSGIPEAIREMLTSRAAVEALGNMIWCVFIYNFICVMCQLLSFQFLFSKF